MDRPWPEIRFKRWASILVAGVLLFPRAGFALRAGQEDKPPTTRLTKDVLPPVPLHKPEPPYTKHARKKKVQGTVLLWLAVDEQGNVTEVEVKKSLEKTLDESAIKTCRTWTFKPATRNGVPVSVRVMAEVSFRLF